MERNFIVMMLQRKDDALKVWTIRVPSSWFNSLKIDAT